jgi:holo-[acyl-carrier protein] synthase
LGGIVVDRSQGGLRVGVDLASIEEVEQAMERFGDRYVRRVFTGHEIESCTRGSELKASGLAARFAAKEALIKALRPGPRQPDYRSIELHRHPDGWCELKLSGTAAEMAEAACVRQLTVSITHEAGMAAAVVVAMCEQQTR